MPDDLIQLLSDPSELMRALLDPTAPVPAGWPTGELGAFLLFMFPVGGGIPLAILRGRNEGLSLPLLVLLYFLSDVLLACVNEPLLMVMRFLGQVFPPLGRVGRFLIRLTHRVGMDSRGARGPLSLIMVSFSISPTTGRAAAAAAGHGFVPGWSLAIAGDMLYFGLLLASTLWLSSILGDERLTVGAVILATLVVPSLVRRWRSSRETVPAPAHLASVPSSPAVVPTRPVAALRPALVAQPPRTARNGGRRSGRKKRR